MMSIGSSRVVSKCLEGRQASSRSYTSSSLSFTTQPMSYTKIMNIKKARFGEELGGFKATYEEPFIKLHAEIQANKTRAAKRLQNKQASRSARARRSQIHAAKAHELHKIDRAEFDLQDKIRNMLEEKEVTLAQFMVSGDPRVKASINEENPFNNIKMNFDAFDEEAVQSDKWWSTGYLNAAFMPNKLEGAPTERPGWEKHLPRNEWVKVVSSEILAHGLPLREDMRVLEGTLETALEAEFEDQGSRLSAPPAQVGIAKPLSDKYPPVEVTSPAVLRKQKRVAKQVVAKKEKLAYLDDRCPFIIETDEYPLLTAMGKKTSRIPSAYIQRKAKLRVHIPSLGMPAIVRSRLVELAKTRFDPKKQILTLVSASKPTRDENIAHVYKIAANMFNEAWKADLNYVSLGDTLPPHEQIQRELDLEQEAMQEANENDPTSFIKEGQYTLFRITSFPAPESIENGRKMVQELVEQLETL